jgi:aryl-alcohol dehydrogenase (NADP+)
VWKNRWTIDFCQLGPNDEKFVDSLVPPGHASTPGYTGPNYPVEGRRIIS